MVNTKFVVYICYGIAAIGVIIGLQTLLEPDRFSSITIAILVLGLGAFAYLLTYRVSKPVMKWVIVIVPFCVVFGSVGALTVDGKNPDWRTVGLTLLIIPSAILSVAVGIAASEDSKKALSLWWIVGLVLGSGIMTVIGALMFNACESRAELWPKPLGVWWDERWHTLCEPTETAPIFGYVIVFTTVPFFGAGMQVLIKKWLKLCGTN